MTSKGVDYLHLGPIHLRTHLRYQSLLTPAENNRIDRVLLAGLSAAAPFLDIALHNAAGRATAAPGFVNQ